MRTRDDRRRTTGIDQAERRLNVGDRRLPAGGAGRSRSERASIERVDRKEQQSLGSHLRAEARKSIAGAALIRIKAKNRLVPEQNDPRFRPFLREAQRRLNGDFRSDTVRLADRQRNDAHSGMANSVLMRELSQTTMRSLSLAMSSLIA